MTSYKAPADLRRALETRLNQQAEINGTDLDRLRRRALFDRISAFLTAEASDRWILEGGAALKFRLLTLERHIPGSSGKPRKAYIDLQAYAPQC